MRKRSYAPVEGVSNIELFYDLIFVYCISVITSLMHHVEGSFPTLETWVIYQFTFLVVLQVWFFTTLLINRYGDRSAADNVCLFVNMFLLYFLSTGIQTDWAETAFTFNASWALILLNLLIHWVIKSRSYDNLDEDDRRIMEAVITVIAAEFVFVVCAAYLEGTPGVVATYIAMAISIGAFSIPPIYRRIFRRKPARFAHLAERCALLTIVAFGETIVAISSYMVTTSSMLYSALVFALVVGLFLIYIFEHDNMLDHHMRTDGLSFTSITVWMIMIIGNLTVALEFMSMWNIAFLPKSVYLMMCLVLYLLTSFVLGRYNRPEFHWSPAYIAGRISACAIVFVGAFITDFDPTITLVVDVIAVWFALWHEWLLYHRRMKLVMFGRSLGDTDEDDEAA